MKKKLLFFLFIFLLTGLYAANVVRIGNTNYSPYATDTTYAISCIQYEWNGENYTKSGTYVKYFEREGQSDSMSVLVLTLVTTDLYSTFITVTNDTVCYNTTAHLTASSTLGYPQYYVWWDKNMNVLAYDTINSGVSHFNPTNQISDSLYYVTVSNDTTSPYVPGIEAGELAEAHVSIRKPLGKEALTAFNDTVCYDNTAHLTASSDMAYPQYFSWYASDCSSLLKQDTVWTEDDQTYLDVEHQISDSLYYVRVEDSLSCPYIPAVHAPHWLPAYKMNKTSVDTTFLSCGDYIPFYDRGGKTGNITGSSTYYRIFKAEPGKQVTLHINTLSLYNSTYSLKIYDGVSASGQHLATLYGNKSDQTFTSTTGALYLQHKSYAGDIGWEGYVTISGCQTVDMAESHVSIKQPLKNHVITVTNDTVCYDDSAYLTASSTLGYPQYYTWWDNDMTTQIGCDTLNSGVSHFNPAHQISDSIYYVYVYNDNNCPYIPEIHKTKSKSSTKTRPTTLKYTKGEYVLKQMSCGEYIRFTYTRGGLALSATEAEPKGALSASAFGDINFIAPPGGKIFLTSFTAKCRGYLVLELEEDGDSVVFRELPIEKGDDSQDLLGLPFTAMYILPTSSSINISANIKSLCEEDENILAEANVSIKPPMRKEVLTATNDTVCYDNSAYLTASSDIAYPQYYNWWDKTGTTLLGRDTVTSGVSHFNPDHQISDSLYYVNIYNDATCPYNPKAHKFYHETGPEFLFDRTTVDTTLVACGESIPFFDAGGEDDDIFVTQATTFIHVFKAEPGSQLVLHIDTLSLGGATLGLKIYDGKDDTGTLTTLSGKKGNQTITSTSGYLYLSQRSTNPASGTTYMGWKGSISTTCIDSTRYLAESQVSALPYIAPANFYNETCQSSEPYNYEIFNNIDVSVAGSYTIDSVFQSAVTGCDSVVTLHLTVNPSYNQEENVTICEKELPLTWHDTTFLAGTVSGDYVLNRQTVNGCDSVMTLHLIINHSTATEFNASCCDTYTWNDSVYTASGDYIQHFETINGCDSTVTLHLTVNPSYNESESRTICQSELPYEWRDTTFLAGTVSGDYVLNRQTINGCDSVMTLHLTVNPTYNLTLSETICQSELPYEWRDTIFQAGTVTGDYIFNKQTVNGCDSIVTLHLTVNPTYNQTVSETICQSELPYEWRDTIFQTGTVTGDYIFNKQTINGCDSVVTLHLTVNPSYNESESRTICQSELPYEWRDTIFQAGTVSGDYVINRKTVNGCDSVMTLHLTVNPSYNESEDLTLCQSELPYEWRDTIFQPGTVTGDYIFNKQTVNGCDSVVTLHLTVTVTYNELENLTICQSELPYEWRDTIFQVGTMTGDYVFNRHAAAGCDSIVTLHLTVNPSYNESDDLTLCQSELPLTWHDTTFLAGTVSGDYVLNRKTVNGCDSVMTLHLTVNPSYNESKDLTLCQSELPYEWRDTIFQPGTVTGDFVFNKQTVNSCDSVVTLHLTVKPTALDMDNLTDYIHCNGSTFSVTPTGNIPEGTLYTWTVADNVNVSGQSAQTTPVAAPISQALTNNSDSKQTVVYTVTPITDECVGDTFTITVDVEPTPELMLTCPADIYDTLEYGSCALLIAPEDLGTPTWASEIGLVLIDTTNNAPADNMYPEGDNIVQWIVTDECGNAYTCEQHIFVIFPECPVAIDYEGNEYKSVRIGCDCWTQRNLESQKYSNGSDIPGVFNYVSDMYPDMNDNVDKFGRLYNWEAAIKDSADNGYGHVQGICPEGWYLPTAEKYDELYKYGAAALKSPLYWMDGGTNETDFSALPAGYYDGSSFRYMNLMGETRFWATSNENGSLKPYSAAIKRLCDDFASLRTTDRNAYSVRCIKEKE